MEEKVKRLQFCAHEALGGLVLLNGNDENNIFTLFNSEILVSSKWKDKYKFLGSI